MVDVEHSTLDDGHAHPLGYQQSSDPGAIGEGVSWVDTSEGTGKWILKVRNAADTGWEIPHRIGWNCVAKVKKTGDQTIGGNGTYSTLEFDTEEFDTDAMANLGSNDDRITIKTAGIYVISASTTLDWDYSGIRPFTLYVTKNGVRQETGFHEGPRDPGEIQNVGITTMFSLLINDYIGLHFHHLDLGSSRWVYHTYLQVWKIGEL